MKLAVITARGGSKRIPRKNIKEFCGQPILCYSIRAAIESKLFNEVMVSTDDTEIAETSIKYGATVPFMRGTETSGDFATTVDVLKEVLTQYKVLGREFEYCCCIYPTAPFVTPEKLKECFKLMTDNNCDSALPVVRYSFPPQRAFVLRNGKINYQYPQYERTRSQDLEPIYHDSGQFYFFNVQNFFKQNTMIDNNTYPFIVPDEEVQDIDTLSDWEIAEMKYKLLSADKKTRYK